MTAEGITGATVPSFGRLAVKTGSSLAIEGTQAAAIVEASGERRERSVEVVPASGRQERTLGLVLDEPTVGEWEQRLSELRSRVTTEEVGEGWRVRIDQADALISRTGLQDGDLITHESVQSQLAVTERAPVMNRFLAVLRALRR